MLTHVVIFNWTAGTAAEKIERLGKALDRMALSVAGLSAMKHGPDLGVREGNGDYALVASFPDREAWAAYQADPTHKAFVRDHVAPILASRVTIQF